MIDMQFTWRGTYQKLKEYVKPKKNYCLTYYTKSDKNQAWNFKIVTFNGSLLDRLKYHIKRLFKGKKIIYFDAIKLVEITADDYDLPKEELISKYPYHKGERDNG